MKPLSNKVKEQIEELGGKTLFFNVPDINVFQYPAVSQFKIDEVCYESEYNSLFIINKNYIFLVAATDFRGSYNVALLGSYDKFRPIIGYDKIIHDMGEVGVVQCFKMALEVAELDEEELCELREMGLIQDFKFEED